MECDIDQKSSACQQDLSSNTLRENYTEICEGKANILFPKKNTVFYNNVQVFNRDLSISVIKYFLKVFHINKKNPATAENYASVNKALVEDERVIPTTDDSKVEKGENECDSERKKIQILEALSATGLRAIRYATEIPGVDRIVANDLSKTAVENIERNIKHNRVEHIVESSNADASLLLYQNRYPFKKRFQVIDLDPYGSPCQFLDGALQAIDDGGLLAVTCTDMGALCGNHGDAAYAKYGGLPLKAKYCHEMALRLVLACLDSHAGRYKRYIEPLISLSADFYIRLFVRVYTSASEVKRSASKKSYVLHCKGCQAFHLQPVGVNIEEGASKKYKPASGPVVNKRCDECNFEFKIGGPIWSEPIHNLSFIDGLMGNIKLDGPECYKTYERMIGSLTVMSEEMSDQPLYYVLDEICKIVHCRTPPQASFRSALIHAGYDVTGTHCNEMGFKTNAPNSVVWDIIRCWIKEYPVKIRENSNLMSTLLKKETKLEAKFDVIQEAVPKSKQLGLTRFPMNPEVDWGPKSRARLTNSYSNLSEKRKALQGKRQGNKDDNKKLKTEEGPCENNSDSNNDSNIKIGSNGEDSGGNVEMMSN